MKKICEIHEYVKNQKQMTIAIANVTEEEILLVKEASDQHLAKFVLVGNENEIIKKMNELGINGKDFPVYNVNSPEEAPEKVMELINKGIADIPMKGQVHTGTFVKAVLNQENGFFEGGRLSQITIFDGYNDSLQLLTDCAINIDYSLEVKVQLIENAVKIAQKFGISLPKVAMLGAVEVVSKKMIDTMESAEIANMNKKGLINNCIVDGPLSLDNAISEKYAKIKEIDSPVAGNADILVATSLNEANSLSKSIIHYAQKPACSVIAGTTKPIIMTSRTDTKSNKLNTIAAACYLIHQ